MARPLSFRLEPPWHQENRTSFARRRSAGTVARLQISLFVVRDRLLWQQRSDLASSTDPSPVVMIATSKCITMGEGRAGGNVITAIIRERPARQKHDTRAEIQQRPVCHGRGAHGPRSRSSILPPCHCRGYRAERHDSGGRHDAEHRLQPTHRKSSPVVSRPTSGSSRRGASAAMHFMARRVASRCRGTGIAPARLNRGMLGGECLLLSKV
jgi:hypothetical protein